MSTTSYRSSSPFVVEDLEQQLLFSLRPVQPSQEFVNHLQQRLTSPPAMTVDREYKILGMLLVAVSLFSGLMLVLLMRRLRGV
jgi:hypothetical protein